MASFYVIGADLAEALRNLSQRITTDIGRRLVILTARSPLPWTILDASNMNTMKSAISRLFNRTSGVLDLSNFRDADEFRQKGLYIVVERANVLKAIVQLIIEVAASDLLALNLRDNRLSFLEMLQPLTEQCPCLKAIDLSKNKVN